MEIFEGIPTRDFQTIGPVRARITSKTIFSPERTHDEVNVKLVAAAAVLGANGIIGVQYQRGASFSSWRALTANGTAVRFNDAPIAGGNGLPNASLAASLHDNDKVCPDCAETIRKDARKCRFCGMVFDSTNTEPGKTQL